MPHTREGILAEMHALETVRELAAELEAVAPESLMLHELREAQRCAHSACTDAKNNPELHKAYPAYREHRAKLRAEAGAEPADTRVE